jgi:hypothetical protein
MKSLNFKNSRGIRQRCRLSALLFVLSVEIMALNLRSCKDIKIITVKLDEKKHSIKITLLLPKYIPSDLIGLSVLLIPAILYLQFLVYQSIPPSVLFLFNNKPENEPLSWNTSTMSFISFVICFICRNHGPKFEKLQRYKKNNSQIR